MARITYTNLFSEARSNVVSLIDNRSNVADPVSSSSEHRKFVYSREPDTKADEFPGYPFIIVHGSDFEPEREGGSADGKSKFVSWEIEIEIVGSDRGYGNNDGQGLSHVESISNDIAETLMNITNRKTLQSQAMFFADFDSSQIDDQDIAEEKVFRRSFILGFRSRIQVST